MLEDATEFTVSVTSDRGELSRISLNRIEQEIRRAVEKCIAWEDEHRENLERRQIAGSVDTALISARIESIRVQTGVLT